MSVGVVSNRQGHWSSVQTVQYTCTYSHTIAGSSQLWDSGCLRLIYPPKTDSVDDKSSGLLSHCCLLWCNSDSSIINSWSWFRRSNKQEWVVFDMLEAASYYGQSYCPSVVIQRPNWFSRGLPLLGVESIRPPSHLPAVSHTCTTSPPLPPPPLLPFLLLLLLLLLLAWAPTAPRWKRAWKPSSWAPAYWT